MDKGLDTLLSLSRLVDEGPLRGRLRIDFYGQASDDYFARHLAPIPYYTYRGTLAPEQVIPTLRRYGALVFPTHYEGEGCPGILIEALAAGLPIVASQWKDNDEFVQAGVNGYLCPTHSAEAYAEAFAALLADPHLAARMGEASLRLSEGFSSTRAASLMDNILNPCSK